MVATLHAWLPWLVILLPLLAVIALQLRSARRRSAPSRWDNGDHSGGVTTIAGLAPEHHAGTSAGSETYSAGDHSG